LSKLADILIRNGIVITVDGGRRIIEDGAVAVEGDRIVDVGKTSEVTKRHKAEKVIDARGKMVMPGLINTHDHLFQILYKSLGDDLELFGWVNSVISLSSYLKEKDCYYSALAGCLEMIKSGTTCVSEFHYVNFKPVFYDDTAKGILDSGMRGVVSRGTSDNTSMPAPKFLVEDTEKAVKESKRLAEKWNGKGDGRIRFGISPGLPPWGTNELLHRVRDLATKLKLPLSVHTSETQREVEESKKMYGVRPVELMNSLGFLGPDVLCIHCVWLSDREIRILAATDTKVSHNPTSNMYLASGPSPIHRLREAGVTVSLGLDGAASNNNQDMVELMKMAVLLNKVSTLDPTSMTAEAAIEMATINGARALGIEKETGSIQKGKKADIAIANLKNLATTPINRPYSQLIYCANGSIIDTTIANGKILMENRRILGMDEEEVIRRTQKTADGVVQRSGKMHLRTRPWRSVSY
jgi:5-methylthioadenosine/S-adenosylhomocysteine deaminase